mgnify:CR=1 FL=1|jgi:hypothetical protein
MPCHRVEGSLFFNHFFPYRNLIVGKFDEFSMSIAKGDGGLEMAHDVAESALGIMQADGDSLSDEGAKCGL